MEDISEPESEEMADFAQFSMDCAGSGDLYERFIDRMNREDLTPDRIREWFENRELNGKRSYAVDPATCESIMKNRKSLTEPEIIVY